MKTQSKTLRHSEELLSISAKLSDAATPLTSESMTKPLEAVEDAVKEVGKSFSGSWLGYHACVYYAGFKPPPPGAHFSQEWGLKNLTGTSLGSRGDWREYSFEQVKARIEELSGAPVNLDAPRKAADSAQEVFRSLSGDILSIFETSLSEGPDAFLEKLKTDLNALEPLSTGEVAQRLAPKGQTMTRDMIALGQGTKVPPHITAFAQAAAIRQAFAICKAAAEISSKAASHLERKNALMRPASARKVGTHVVIGHGRSTTWRELKDFIQDRLKLPSDEFNRVPVAGITNVERLSQMLDGAAFAFLVMTAEDETADGRFQPRMNVVHESGLFQGRLGFRRAIVLLEEGCEEFSNIEGLGQLRFPKGPPRAIDVKSPVLGAAVQ